jgi:hypothetical protein
MNLFGSSYTAHLLRGSRFTIVSGAILVSLAIHPYAAPLSVGTFTDSVKSKFCALETLEIPPNPPC